MYLDRIEGKADEAVAWGSDVAAQMLRRFGIPYVSLNPGASYRGLHDSLVNHLGNETPGMLLCMHEDHAVAIAHGYAKRSEEHTSELQSRQYLVCRLLLEKKKQQY